MSKWMPLIIGGLIVVIGGFFASLEIGLHFGQGWQFGFMPVEFILGGLVGSFGISHAMRRTR